MAHETYIPQQKHFINNAEFYQAIVDWRKKDTENKTPVPFDVYDNFQKIINKKSNKYNFREYSFLDEMKLSAMELCIRAARKFDHITYNNPYWYFDTIITNAFLIQIKKEKKLNEYRYNKMENEMINQRQLDYTTICRSNRDDHGRYIDPELTQEENDKLNETFWDKCKVIEENE